MTACRPRGRDGSAQARARRPHECGRRLVDLANHPSDHAWTGKRIGVRYARHPRINGAPGRCGGRAHEVVLEAQALAGVALGPGRVVAERRPHSSRRSRTASRTSRRISSEPGVGPSARGDHHRAYHRAERHRRATTRVVAAAEQRLQVGQGSAPPARGRPPAPARRRAAVRVRVSPLPSPVWLRDFLFPGTCRRAWNRPPEWETKGRWPADMARGRSPRSPGNPHEHLVCRRTRTEATTTSPSWCSRFDAVISASAASANFRPANTVP
jgi:hypothetical protein